MASTLSRDGELWTRGAFTVLNDTWNKGALVNGKDFTQRITYDPATFPNGTSLDWSYPQAGNGQIYGYPNISWSIGATAVRVADIANLSATYTFRISGDTKNFDVAFEAWLYSAPGGVFNTITDEVMLGVHSNGWTPVFNGAFADGVLDTDVYIDPKWSDAGGGSSHTWQYVAAINKTDKLSGTISFSNLPKELIWDGVIDGNEYISTVEVGAEPAKGAGSLKIDNLAYSLELKTPVAGTDGDDLIKALVVGRNTIEGGYGTDTVVYTGSQSAYDFKLGGPGVLVRGKANPFSLDILTSVEKIQFDDAVFDAATGAVSPYTAPVVPTAKPPPATPSTTPTTTTPPATTTPAAPTPPATTTPAPSGGTTTTTPPPTPAAASSMAWATGVYADILRTPEAAQGAAIRADVILDAVKLDLGQMTRAQVIQHAVQDADATTTVATLSYQFFTGKIPSQGGIDYLVSPTGGNAANLNSAYYQSFNLENRYINFAVNLGKLGDGRAGFETAYGSKTLADTVKGAYTTIFGSAPTDAKVADLLNSRVSYFASFGGDGPNGVGTKAAAVGWLLAEAAKADVGVYSRASDAFLTDLSDGAAFGVDLVGVYGGSGFGPFS